MEKQEKRPIPPEHLYLVLWFCIILGLSAGAPVYLRTFSLLIYTLLLSYVLGQRLAPRARTAVSSLAGFLSLCGYFVLLGTALFYLNALSYISFAVVILASPVLMGIRGVALPKQILSEPRMVDIRLKVLYALYFVLVTLCALVLLRAQTTESAVSPWILVHPSLFALFFTLLFVTYALIFRSRFASPYLLVPIFFFAFSVATAVFPLGFGYDPFIHDATISLLNASGTIEPKPLYYIGYYVLVLLIKMLSGLQIATVNAWFTPMASSLFLPVALYGLLRYVLAERRYALLLPMAVLILPYPELIQSTPQSASFLWSLLVVVLSMLRLTAPVIPWSVIFVTAATAAAFHPLTGIPLILAVATAYGWSALPKSPLRTSLLAVSATFTALAIPLLLLWVGARSGEFAVQLVVPNFSGVANDLAGPLYRYISLDDAVYGFSNLAFILTLSLTVYGSVYAARRQMLSRTLPLLVSGAAIFLSYLIVRSSLQFDFATVSEQSVFAERLLTLSRYLLLPSMLFGAYALMKAPPRPAGMRSIPIALFCLLATASWYLSYPRFDTRMHSKGYTAGAADYTAVRWIEKDSAGAPYVVLANQTVSAVAVKEYGFHHYYNGLFYYPLPTNGPLYSYYLRSVSDPENAPQHAAEVAQLAGVKLVYIVLNRYWDLYPVVAEKLRSEANASATLAGDRVRVFRFDTE